MALVDPSLNVWLPGTIDATAGEYGTFKRPVLFQQDAISMYLLLCTDFMLNEMHVYTHT